MQYFHLMYCTFIKTRNLWCKYFNWWNQWLDVFLQSRDVESFIMSWKQRDGRSIMDIWLYVNIKSIKRESDKKWKKQIKEIHQKDVSEIKWQKSRITCLLFWSLTFSQNLHLWDEALLKIAHLLIFHWTHFYLILYYLIWSYSLFLHFCFSPHCIHPNWWLWSLSVYVDSSKVRLRTVYNKILGHDHAWTSFRGWGIRD